MNKEIEHIQVIAKLVTSDGKEFELTDKSFPVRISKKTILNGIRKYIIHASKSTGNLMMNGEK